MSVSAAAACAMSAGLALLTFSPPHAHIVVNNKMLIVLTSSLYGFFCIDVNHEEDMARTYQSVTRYQQSQRSSSLSISRVTSVPGASIAMIPLSITSCGYW